MKKNNVLDNRSIIVIPFKYKYDKWDDLENDETIGYRWAKEQISVNSTFDSIRNKLNGNSETGSIGALYVLKDDIKNELDIPKNDHKITIKYKDEDLAIAKLDKVDLALFYNDVCFLCFEFSYTEDNFIINEIATENFSPKETALKKLEIIENTNYYLSQLKRSEGNKENVKCFWKAYIKKGEDPIDKSTTLYKMISNVLKGLNPESFIIDEKHKNNTLTFINNPCMIFGNVYLEYENALEEKDNYLMFENITELQKSSYKKYVDENLYYRPFENNLWCFSYNGFYSFICKTNDEITEKYFKENHHDRLRYVYFLLFLLRAHQRYSIVESNERIAKELVCDYESLLKDDKIKEFRKMELELSNTNLLTDFSTPTNISHVNRYDEMLANSFKVEQNLARTEKHLKEINYHIETLNQIEDKKRAIKSVKFDFFTTIGNAVWATLFAINQGIDVLQKFFPNISRNSLILGILFAASITIISYGINFYDTIISYKKLKKEVFDYKS